MTHESEQITFCLDAESYVRCILAHGGEDFNDMAALFRVQDIAIFNDLRIFKGSCIWQLMHGALTTIEGDPTWAHMATGTHMV